MFLKIGIVGRALGLQGSFYVYGRDEALPGSIRSIKIGATLEVAQEAQIVKTAWQNGRASVICSLATNRTEAELLKGMNIWVHESQIHLINDREYLLIDLIGRQVIDVEGAVIGRVEVVLKQPASFNMLIVNQDQTADVEIPLIGDYVDMSFRRGDGVIKLTVNKDVFADIWNPRSKNQS